MMNVNQFYSENMAEDIKRGLQDNAMQAKVTGSLPYGYKAAPDLHYEIDSPKTRLSVRFSAVWPLAIPMQTSSGI